MEQHRRALFRSVAFDFMERNNIKMTTFTEAQIAAKKAQLAAEGAEIDAELQSAIATKSFSMLDDLQVKIDQLAERRADLDQAEARHKAAAGHPLNPFAAGSLADDERRDVPADIRRLAFTKSMAEGWWPARRSRLPVVPLW
jgi:hypothetical protein